MKSFIVLCLFLFTLMPAGFYFANALHHLVDIGPWIAAFSIAMWLFYDLYSGFRQ